MFREFRINFLEILIKCRLQVLGSRDLKQASSLVVHFEILIAIIHSGAGGIRSINQAEGGI
jgi:hypothetical protein